MTRKEQEILAILGLIISLFLVGWTFFNRFTGRETPQPKVQETQKEIEQEPIRNEREIHAIREAEEYGGKIVNALVKEPRYDFVYHQFSETVKEDFEFNQHNLRLQLERMFGRLGKANRIQLTYQEATELKSGAFQVENRYIIGYPRLSRDMADNTRFLEMVVLIDENEDVKDYQLLMIDFKLLSNLGRGD